MTPRSIWWTRQIFGLKFYLLFVLIAALLILAYVGRGFAI